MLRRALVFVALSLSVSVHAQESTERGAFVGFGYVSPEALTLNLGGDQWTAGYRTADGWTAGVLFSAEHRSYTDLYTPFNARDELARNYNSSQYRGGVLGAKDTPTSLGIVRIGATVAYGEYNSRSIGFTLQPQPVYGGMSSSEPATDTLMVLLADGTRRTQQTDQTLHLGSSVSIRVPLFVGSRTQLSPGAGLAFGTTRMLSNRDVDLEESRTTAYLQMPVRARVTDRIGATLDMSVGYSAMRPSRLYREITGTSIRFEPSVGAAMRVDF